MELGTGRGVAGVVCILAKEDLQAGRLAVETREVRDVPVMRGRIGRVPRNLEAIETRAQDREVSLGFVGDPVRALEALPGEAGIDLGGREEATV